MSRLNPYFFRSSFLLAADVSKSSHLHRLGIVHDDIERRSQLMGHHPEKFIFDAIRSIQLRGLIAGFFIEPRVIDGHGSPTDQAVYEIDLFGSKLMLIGCVERKDSQRLSFGDQRRSEERRVGKECRSR